MLNVLVTGGCGFIGSEFVRQFGKKYKLTIMDSLEYSGNDNRINHEYYKWDIVGVDSLYRDIDLNNPDVIINFAAQTHVDNSIKDSYPFIHSNITGVQCLLDFARKNHIPKFIHISTDEVYGESLKMGFEGFKETDTLNPRNPYSATKAAAELLIKSYENTYGIKTIIVRPSNNYGLWQDTEKFIPKTITNILRKKPVPVYGKGEQIREWLHVSDCVKAIDLLIKKGVPGEVYNVGSGYESNNLNTVKTILKSMRQSDKLIKFVQDRPGHDFRYKVDSSKIKSLGWKPKISFNDGIKETIKWYKENLNVC